MGSASRQCLLSTLALILAIISSYIQTGSTGPAYDKYKKPGEKGGNKLLIFVIDGFRWNYYDQNKESLPNFQAFLEDGVQAKWVEPIFPSASYPSWHTISTGVYPDVHDVSANYMYDVNAENPSEAVFSIGLLETTKLPKWWQSAEPIWITATKHGKKAFTRFWSRSDVPYHGLLPKEYSGYEENDYIDNSLQIVSDSFEIAILKFLEGFDLCMIYADKLDTVGHVNGPDSPEMKAALIGIDKYLGNLLGLVELFYLKEKLNIVLVSDHGMTYTGPGSGFQTILLDKYVDKDDVIKVVSNGIFLTIATLPGRLEKVYNSLKSAEGLDVYKHDDIPKKYNIKGSKYILDLLLIAHDKFLIIGLQNTDKQLPFSISTAISNGAHGYPKTVEDMRAIFFAKGPDFKSGYVAEPMHMEDEYQIFAKLLSIPAQPNNGSWSRVKDMFVDKDEDTDEDEDEYESY